MSLVCWFTRNWANTIEPTHPDLRPFQMRVNPADAIAIVGTVVEQGFHNPSFQRRWQVVDGSVWTMSLHLTRRTPILRFIDDVRLTFQPGSEANTCVIHAESRSRIGVGDLGQNRRNILELWTGLRAGMDPMTIIAN